ncbi:MAG: 4-(cytidine 5'-diphospho)-2-C-methyl-D-erythritol kinase [Chlamydiae bacterium]|nr:4-(cytidine 5'-diphospho)-2-C-methyl-D-erythritol kinase [Chlamydiota bacterium]
MSITLFSPAKINLNFKLIGKREDGYHLIESDMVAINLFDTLTIEPYFSNVLEGTFPLPFDFEGSIFQKGYNLLKKRFSTIPCVKITLDKKIPIGAGLGGGSSNLASFLWGMNQLFDLKYSDHELAHLGGLCGADVPFFFSEGSAFADGIGTNIQKTDYHLQTFTLFLIEDKISTPKVYAAVDLTQVDMEAINQLEKFAVIAYPDYQYKIDRIRGEYPKSFMSGSGSTFVVEEHVEAFPSLGPYFHAHTIQRSRNTWYQK